MSMNRVMEVVSPLGPDLLFRQMSGEESLGRLFEYRVDLLSTKPDIKPDQMLGQGMTVKLEQSNGEARCFNGYVTRFSSGAYNGKHYAYQAVLRPWTWILTRKTDCRIFQDMTVPQILNKVFEDYPQLVAIDDKLTGEYRKWEYCVQYRESDFNFISRLMEHEGIYYHFEHTETEHKMVLVDLFSTHKETPKFGSLPYYHESVRTRPGAEYVSRWQHSHEMRSGEVETWDYDFKTPPKPVRAKKPNIKEPALTSAQVFDYPGGYVENSDGEQYAGVRLEELQTGYEAANATTNARAVRVGTLLTITNHPTHNAQYLVTRASYNLSYNAYESTGGEEATYGCSFSVVPAKQQFRPRRSTPKPIVQGPQTATVVGPDGEEIYTDEFGRVKVKFHWDRHEPKDGKEENRSCWIRVSHPWAGKKWGMIAIPRVLQEVIVDFLEGDPDQPIITGRVYNGDQMPPYDLPANATQTGIKSRSSKGGDPQNYNEIRFEDKKGSEMVTVHAEKDMSKTVENDDTTVVQHDQFLTVVHDQRTVVKHDQHLLVENDRTSQVDKNESHTVNVNQQVKVVGNQDIEVVGNHTTIVKTDYLLDVKGKIGTNTDANRDDNTKGNHGANVDGNQLVTIKGNQTTGVTGNVVIKGATILLEAGHIEQKVTGGNSLVVESPSGPYTIMANKFAVLSNTDINLFGIANINSTSMGNNTTVMGPNASGYIGMSSDTWMGLNRSTALGVAIETFMGAQLSTTIAAQMETVVAAKLGITAGVEIQMGSMTMYVPGGGGGGGGATVMSEAAVSNAIVGAAIGAQVALISTALGFQELSDQYKDARAQLRDAAREAAAAGHPGLAARLNRLAETETRVTPFTSQSAPESGDNIKSTQDMNPGDRPFANQTTGEGSKPNDLRGPGAPTTDNTGAPTHPDGPHTHGDGNSGN